MLTLRGPSTRTPEAAAVQTPKSDLQPDDKLTLDCDAPARQPGALRVRLVVLGAQQPGVAAGWFIAWSGTLSSTAALHDPRADRGVLCA